MWWAVSELLKSLPTDGRKSQSDLDNDSDHILCSKFIALESTDDTPPNHSQFIIEEKLSF